MIIIGEQIRRRRLEKGLTGVQLAEKAGMAPSAVSQIETGRRSPHSASVIKLAAALEVEVADLYPKVPSQPSLHWLANEEIPAFRAEDLSDVERAEYERVKRGEKPRAYFVPLEEGEEEDTVTFQIYYVRLLEGDEPILKAMREASPEEAATIREELEKAGREPV